MINNISRIGNFTSSEIGALMSVGSRKMDETELEAFKKANPKSKKTTIECWPGDKAKTYIEEKNMERQLDRSLGAEVNARPLTWGKLVEKQAFDQLGTEYILSSTETDVHPTIAFWAGSKDGIKHDEGKTVSDIKCPVTLKSFCQLVAPLYDGLNGMEAVNALINGFTDSHGREHSAHKSIEDYYWQLVSNGCINRCRYAELIIYMPYHSELQEIRERAAGVDPEKLSAHYWIAMSMDDDLPYIKDGGYYKNLNIIRFEIPQCDKDALTENVLKAGKMLIGNESVPELKPIAEPKKIQLTKIQP